MNRLEFIGQAYQNKLISIDDIVVFFDHMMAAYEIIKDIKDIRIDGYIDRIQYIFTIRIDSSNSLNINYLLNYVNSVLHNRKTIYGRTFEINASVEYNRLDLIVREYVS